MFAIVSDIHSNLEALSAVLADIKSQGIDEIICLGDIVGYGPNPVECLALAREFDLNILGNHDQAVLDGPSEFFTERAANAVYWTANRLSDEDMEFISSFREMVSSKKMTYVHGSPRNPTSEYIMPTDPVYSQDKMENIFSLLEHACFVGHTHFAGLFLKSSMSFYKAVGLGNSASLVPKEKLIVNVGSVGQPRDGDPSACYVVVDNKNIKWRRVPYDFKATMQKIYDIPHLDNSLAIRLEQGR